MFENLQLKNKVLIILLISLSVVALLGASNTRLFLNEHSEAKETKTSIQLMRATSKFVHHLQRERGRSSMFVSGGVNTEDLKKFRDETDQYLKSWLAVLELSSVANKELVSNEVDELSRIRGNVDKKESALSVVDMYTAHIERILSLDANLVQNTSHADLVRMFGTILLLEEAKEDAGRLRAALSTHLTKNQALDKNQLERMLRHKVAVLINLNSRSLMLSKESQAKLEELKQGSNWKYVDEVFYKVLKNYEVGNYNEDPKVFFEAISALIDGFASIIDNEEGYVDSKVEGIILTSRNDAIVVGGICLFAILFSLFALWLLNKDIAHIVNSLLDETQMLVRSAKDGKLNVRADSRKIHPEFRGITDGLNDVVSIMSTIFTEAMYVMDQVAQKNLNVKMVNECQGEFLVFKDNMNNALGDLCLTVEQVIDDIEQVNSGANQVAQMSQSLSQGAQQQAASLEEISASVHEMSGQTKQSAESANSAKELSHKAKSLAEGGNQKMTLMLHSMSEINDASQSISKIIKVIDEIAFQTNLLALNAAVEAARAGKHGKGFAVVAEEVRNLAARSAQAAKETTSLIESTKMKVEQGVNTAKETEEALLLIREEIEHVADIAGEIAKASQHQAVGINEISLALGQIDQVTQANSAAAEESASSAEILSNQAMNINSIMQQFKVS